MRRLSITLLISVLLLTRFVLADEKKIEYSALFIDGAKAGHVQHSRTVKNNIVKTSEKTTVAITRGESTIKIVTTETSFENTAGKPLGFEVLQDISGMVQRIQGKVNTPGKFDITTTMMGNTQKKTVDLDDDAIMLEGMRLLQIKKGLKEGTAYTAKIFSPSMQKTIDASVTIGPKKNVDLLGRIVPLTEVAIEMSTPAGAVKSTSYVDDESNAMKTSVPAMGMNMEIISCDKEFALSENQLVDFLDKMLIKSPTPITESQRKYSKAMKFTIVPKDSAKLAIPKTDSQNVKDLGEKLVVTVKPTIAKEGVTFPYSGEDQEILDALKPTQYLQSDDRNIIAAAKKAVTGATDTAKAVDNIAKFVAAHIDEKNLSVGYATALEVLNSKQGDCTEHAVLTAAMCRAIGIPAQVVTGIAYAEDFAGHRNIFGGHAWAQAYIGDKWVGVDPTTLPMRFDPTHIVMAAGDGDPTDFFAMINTFGNFTIEEIEIIEQENISMPAENTSTE